MADFHKGTFTCPGATGNQGITGVGFTPKALYIWSTVQSAAGFASTGLLMIGMTDGTNQRVMFQSIDDAAATTRSRRASSATLLIDTYASVDSANLSRATIVSLDADGFTVNWSVVASGQIFHFIAIGGAGVSAYVGTLGSEGNYAEEAIGFDALAFLLATIGSTSAAQAIANGNTFGVGHAARQAGGAFQQGTISINSANGSAAANVARYQRSARALAQLASNNALSMEYAYGANLGFRLASSNDELGFLLALGGIQAKAGVANQPTSSGTQAITGLGFTPKLVLVLSYGFTTSATVLTDALRLSIGAGDGTRRGLAWIGENDTADPTEVAVRHATDQIVTMSTPNATGANSTTEAEADLQSLDADGFTLNWGTADATAREWLWMAFGDAAAAAGDAGAGSRFNRGFN